MPRIVTWFQSLPPEPVIKWTDACLSEEEPIGSVFVDVEVPPLLRELEVGWIWTIVPPDDPNPPCALEVRLDYDVDGGWTPLHMSDGLSRWVSQHVGRDDVHFVCDPSMWSMVRWVVQDAAAEMKDEEAIEIGEGVRATPGVMDYLLEFPWETAAKITATMQGMRDQHVAGTDPAADAPFTNHVLPPGPESDGGAIGW